MMVRQNVAVLSVSNNASMDPASTLSLQLDLRHAKSWRQDHRYGADSIPGPGARYFLLDYNWVPHIYYDKGENNVNGYGGLWFSDILPIYFRGGGLVAILPNDNGGFLMRMHSSNPEIAIRLLTSAEALLCHPLYMATQTLTQDGELTGVGAGHGRYRTNESSVRQWLDTEHPFCLAFNQEAFHSAQDALDDLRSLMS